MIPTIPISFKCVQEFHKELDKEIPPEVKAKLYKTASEMGTIMSENVERMVLRTFLNVAS